jgi:hypothetical protein
MLPVGRDGAPTGQPWLLRQITRKIQFRKPFAGITPTEGKPMPMNVLTPELKGSDPAQIRARIQVAAEALDFVRGLAARA